ncbi:TetR/AcrR family transcriptional regulator [Fluviibacterium sp. DFM31]|uniref:TetR/AcrR family transcriptional regulator n=1 Tax=Meridianimarinicoccus marinus TaxID=3231483 RepID=A0ABV3LA21_9RHOB
MARIVKAPEKRRAEIVETAERLFREVGYANCSVETIIREVGVAKGTFYYYFKSKPDILEAIVDKTLRQIVEIAEGIADDPSLTAMQKMAALLGNSHIGNDDSLDVAEMLHLPENRELHELTNVQTVLQLSPILARIVEQGIDEGVFEVENPLETIQFLFTGAQFLTEGDMFGFSRDELRKRRLVTQAIIEKTLGAPPGSFHFMNPGRELEQRHAQGKTQGSPARGRAAPKAPQP